MNDRLRIKKSQKLAYLLRHDKKYTFKEDGWRAVSNVLDILQITFEELEEIVAKDSKKRYVFSEDKTNVRAVDGFDEFIPHSRKAPAVDFPDTLFHGTSYKAVKSILNQGILPMGRAYVHLSSDKSTALSIGRRHKMPVSQPVVLCINTKAMQMSGVNIYPPEAAAWLADYISPDFIASKMLIGFRVSYYENEDQAKAVLSICNDPDTHLMIINGFAQEKDSKLRSINYIDDAASIANLISFENDAVNRTIIAYIPISTSADEHEYWTVYNHLTCYIRELQNRFLADRLLHCMPNTEIEDKSRALFYLELASTYQCNTNIIYPLDWYDIKKLWEKHSRFTFFPLIIADSIFSLLSRLSENVEAFKARKSISCVIWLCIPTNAAGNYGEIMAFASEMHQEGTDLLLGVSSRNGQGFLANIAIMEDIR